MVQLGEQFLVPLKANRKRAEKDFDGLDDTVFRMSARHNRWRQLYDRFTMERIHFDMRHANDLSQLRTGKNLDGMKRVPHVMFIRIRKRGAQIRSETTSVQASEHLHSGAYAEDRLISLQLGLNDCPFNVKAFRSWRFRDFTGYVPVVGVSIPATNRYQAIEFVQNNVHNLREIWDTERYIARVPYPAKISLGCFITSSA